MYEVGPVARYRAHRTRSYLERERRSAALLPRWRTQSRRRLLVLTLIGMLALGAATGIIVLFNAVAGSLLAIPVFLVTIPVWAVLAAVSTRQAEAPRDALNEQELAARNSARSIGLTVTQFLVLVPTVFLLLVSVRGSAPQSTIYGGALLVLTGVLAGGMSPTMILAWNRPPDNDPETREGATH